MIWVPFVSTKANIDVLSVGHLIDVVMQGLQCLRDMYSNVGGRDVQAWGQHPQGLIYYVIYAETEMRRRGFSGEPRVYSAFTYVSRNQESMAPIMPSWYGNPEIHLSQRSHLIRVDPEYYARRLPLTTPLELPLVWPKERKSK